MFSFLIKKEIDSRWNHQSPITNVLHIGFWDRFINFMRDLGKGTQLRIALVGGGVFVSLGITAFPITNNNGTSNSSATIKNNWTSNSKLTASGLDFPLFFGQIFKLFFCSTIFYIPLDFYILNRNEVFLGYRKFQYIQINLSLLLLERYMFYDKYFPLLKF